MNSVKTFMTATAVLSLIAAPSVAWADHHESPNADAILEHLWALEQLQNDGANGVEIPADAPRGAVAPDAVVVFSEGAPVSGMPPAMLATLEDPDFTISTTPLKGWVSESGDLAVTVANTDISARGDDGSIGRQLGTRQFVWMKGDDGVWTIVSIFNAGIRSPE